MKRDMIYIGIVCHECHLAIGTGKKVCYDVEVKNGLEYDITLCEKCKTERSQPFWKKWLGI